MGRKRGLIHWGAWHSKQLNSQSHACKSLINNGIHKVGSGCARKPRVESPQTTSRARCHSLGCAVALASSKEAVCSLWQSILCCDLRGHPKPANEGHLKTG